MEGKNLGGRSGGEASRRLSGVGFGCVAGSGEETGCYMGPARRIFVGET